LKPHVSMWTQTILLFLFILLNQKVIIVFYLLIIQVAILDGITMGGGGGVSIPGTFRIATERTVCQNNLPNFLSFSICSFPCADSHNVILVLSRLDASFNCPFMEMG
jgi:hypothetical protein